MDGSKSFPREVSPSDKVSDVAKRIPNSARGNNRDTSVTSGGRVLRRSEELRSCGVSDGSTIHVTNRMLGGGKLKDKNWKRSAKEDRTKHRVDQEKEKVEQNEARISGMLRERSKEDVERLIKASREHLQDVSVATKVDWGGWWVWMADVTDVSGVGLCTKFHILTGVVGGVIAHRRARCVHLNDPPTCLVPWP